MEDAYAAWFEMETAEEGELFFAKMALVEDETEDTVEEDLGSASVWRKSTSCGSSGRRRREC